MNLPHTLALSRRKMFFALGVTAGFPLLGLRSVLAKTAPFGLIRALIFDGSAVVLVTDRFWRSADGGSSWVQTSSTDASSVTALATHPEFPGRIFAALETGGLMRSDDAGTTWISRNVGLPTGKPTALIVAANAASSVYVAVEGDGIWQSEDSGDSWSFVMDRPYLADAERDVLTLTSVHLATGMGGIWLYAGTEQGLTRVPDCFCRWQDVQAGDAMDALANGEDLGPRKSLPSGEEINALVSAFSAPDTLYAGLVSGIWKSTDAGVNWTKLNSFAAQNISVSPLTPDQVIVANPSTILTSQDGGRSWSPLFNP